MRSLLQASFCFALALSFACGDKKKTAEPEEDEMAEVECESMSDCEAGEVCLDGACAIASGGALLTDPEKAVTPDKVKSEMDAINKAAQERADKALDGL